MIDSTTPQLEELTIRETTGLSAKELLKIIVDSHQRMDRRSEENRTMIQELAEMNQQIVSLLNRQDDRLTRLENRR